MTIKQLVDKQFQMEGIDYDFERMVANGVVKWDVKGKEKSEWWFNLYRFKDQTSYETWKDLCLQHLSPIDFMYLDFKYGMTFKY